MAEFDHVSVDVGGVRYRLDDLNLGERQFADELAELNAHRRVMTHNPPHRPEDHEKALESVIRRIRGLTD